MQRYGMDTLSRRQMLKVMSAAAGYALASQAIALPAEVWAHSQRDEAFLRTYP
jgi:hypothetical protein